MKTNAYLGISIAIFPVNVFWQTLQTLYRFGVFTKTEYIFAQDDISRRRLNRVHYTKKHWYILNCQTATAWFNVDISRKTVFFYDFCGGFSFFLVCFSLSWIKFPPICKIRVHNHVKNACQWSLITAYFM